MPEGAIGLATTVHDPDGALADKIDVLVPAVSRRLAHLSVVVTSETDPRTTTALRRCDRVERADADIWRAGEHRRRSLELALGFGDERILAGDLDHVLRWIERAPDEFDALVLRAEPVDLLVIGRSPTSIAAGPARLRRTEAIVNDVFAAATGHHWDVMMGDRVLSRRAAQVVVARSQEPSLATDVEWPLLVERLGFSVRYVEADGLTYETNPQYGPGEPDDGDRDIEAWLFRLELAERHLAALRDQLAAPPEPWATIAR